MTKILPAHRRMNAEIFWIDTCMPTGVRLDVRGGDGRRGANTPFKEHRLVKGERSEKS